MEDAGGVEDSDMIEELKAMREEDANSSVVLINPLG